MVLEMGQRLKLLPLRCLLPRLPRCLPIPPLLLIRPPVAPLPPLAPLPPIPPLRCFQKHFLKIFHPVSETSSWNLDTSKHNTFSIRHHLATPCLSSSTKYNCFSLSVFLFFIFTFFEELIACNAAILSALHSYWNVTFWFLELSTSYYRLLN